MSVEFIEFAAIACSGLSGGAFVEGLMSLKGNLGGDPEVRYTPGGEPVVSFRLAVTERSSRGGIVSDRTVWHRCIVQGELAELATRLRKGSRVIVAGEIRERTWNQYGRKRTVAELHVGHIELTEPLPGDNSQEWEMPAPKAHSPLEAARAAGLFNDDQD